MHLFYRPDDAWVSGITPYYHDGVHHLFYVPDRRKAGAPAAGWRHATTRDLVHFQDHGDAVAAGDARSPISSGSIIERDGVYHAFYGGGAGASEAVYHATSTDLMRWTPDASFELSPDAQRYEPGTWRGPKVFWNFETGAYWMLVTARTPNGPKDRRGCIALCTSSDLVNWEVQDPFWSPGLYYTHESPDVFQIGEWWYLVYSSSSERFVTHYRMSKSLQGPWHASDRDALDTRAFYGGRTTFDGSRRLAFGVNPTREGESDDGRWQRSGNLTIHEVFQRPSAALVAKPPQEIEDLFTESVGFEPVPQMGRWDHNPRRIASDATDGFTWCRLGALPDTCLLRTTVKWKESTRSCGIILRAHDDLESYYMVRMEPGRGRVTFDRTPHPREQIFMLDRSMALRNGQCSVKVFVDGSIVVVYVNDRVALSARVYDHKDGVLGFFVAEGKGTFTETELLAPGG